MDTGPKNWKRFAERATALRHRHFFKTRGGLTILYTVFCICILVIFGIVLGFSREYEIHEELAGFPKKQIEKTINELERNAFFIGVGAAVVSASLSYFLAGLTLKPIKETIQNQERFIADASHELRTPISIIKTNLEVALLDREKLTREEALSCLESALDDVNRASRLINNLLTLVRSEKKISPDFSQLDISHLVVEIAAEIEKKALSKNINFIVEPTNMPPMVVYGNRDDLEEMFLNVLENAVTYTKPGGSVTLFIEKTSSGLIQFQFKDTGIGIAEDDLKDVFKPFFKGASSRLTQESRSHSGLGLTIVKEIVKKHKGSVEIKSKLGQGTTVKVLLPLVQS